MKTQTWFVEPISQNFYSMYREAVTAQEAATGMERSHHLTAALYFAIAALEAFLNDQKREQCPDSMSEGAIIKLLKNTKLKEKIEKWPNALLPNPIQLSAGVIDRINAFNDIRAALTHPKTAGHETYEGLEEIDADQIILTVAEYIAQFHQAKGDHFRYWLWGWNYLNPRTDTYEIIPISDQQFIHSLYHMGITVPGVRQVDLNTWRRSFMSSFEGYKMVAEALKKVKGCEPKFRDAPFQPKLCRRWWTQEHQRTCGHVTPEAIQQAR